jgi:hypothetical protein
MQGVERSRMQTEWQASPDPAVFDLRQDVFLKDLGVLTFKLLAAGAQLVDIHQGVPRRILLTSGHGAPFASLSCAIYFAFSFGGFASACEIHTSLKQLGEFTPDGWRRCYVRIAELMQLNPGVRGMFGSSWFYDPALSQISPRQDYLRDEPCGYGARVFRVGPDEGSTRNALATSSSRRKLHAEGKYQPCSHMLVWARADVLKFLLAQR